MAANQGSVKSTVPSTNYEDEYDNQSADDDNAQQHQFVPITDPSEDVAFQQHQQQQQQQPQQTTGTVLSAFSSPRLNNSNSYNNLTSIENSQQNNPQLILPNVPISTRLPNDSMHNTPLLMESPLLNGENIVLLSFSNDTTPTGISAPMQGGDNATNMATEIMGGVAHTIMTSVGEANNESSELSHDITGNNMHTANNNDEEEEEENDMTLSPSSLLNLSIGGVSHSSPPPESIHSGQITTLSPPPLSMKSSTSYERGGGAHHHQTSSGSQSLFSHNNRSNTNNNGGPSSSQHNPHPPTVASAGNNTPSKKRPPLPPRWAIGPATAGPPHVGMGGNVGGGAGDMVDVVPGGVHLPPPKQIGPLSHRRVLSTGDASFLSNLTDPDSMQYDGEDGSPPLAAAGAAAAAGGGAAVVGAMPIMQTSHQSSSGGGGGVPNTTNVIMGGTAASSALIQPCFPVNQSSQPRKPRGVSWDFGTGAVAASHSESDGSINNRYKNEEEAAFDTLGILQPILGDFDDDFSNDDDDNNDDGDGLLGDLMQPILLDDKAQPDDDIMGGGGGEPIMLQLGGTSASAFTSSAVSPGATKPITTDDTHPAPPLPPPPPENVVRKQHASNKSMRSLGTIPSLRDISLSKKSVRDLTQFEDEADLAIFEALNEHNMKTLADSIGYRNQEEEEDEEEEFADEQRNEDSGAPHKSAPSSDNESLPSQVVQSESYDHRKDISALTALDLELSPPPTGSMHNATNSRVRGESIFEDSAWTEEYDAQGRIDGTLPEERDSKLINEEGGVLGVGGGVDLNPRVAAATTAAALPRPPLHSKKDTQRSNFSKRAMTKDDDSTSKKKVTIENNVSNKLHANISNDPTAVTGLRHRRAGTIAAKNMAEELAQIAALHSDQNGGIYDPKHQRTKTALTKDGGIDNLLAGVNILAQQDDSSDDGSQQAPVDAGGDGGPHDEEMGNAAPESAKKGPRRLERQSEMWYHLGNWYHDLIKPKLPAFVKGATHSVCFVMLPLLTVACILYYGAGNPIAGGYSAFVVAEEAVGDETNAEEVVGDETNADEAVEDETDKPEGDISGYASWSWWMLFIARQAFILSCVKTGEVISIEILALRTPLFVKTIGTFATLMFVQARGWPYVLTFWSLCDFAFLFGSHPFAKHWLCWQDWIGLFNESNPSGSFLHSEFYMRILIAAMFIGVSTSVRRLWLATFLGKRSYAHYGPELEIILSKMLLVSQVAHLARQIESQVVTSHVTLSLGYTMGQSKIALPGLTTDSEDEGTSPPRSKKSFDELSGSANKNQQNGFGASLLAAGIGSKLVSSLSRPRLENNSRTSKLKSSKKLMSSSTKLEILQLLEEWEEPDIKTNSVSRASIKDILQFRQACSLMSDDYPFTPAFGLASTRHMCVESSENLFARLLHRSTNTTPLLPFETLSEIAYDFNGQLMRDKVKALIKLFRPDRKGFLTKLDFVASIDDVYKDLRLFRASLANSSSIDDSLETMINLVLSIVVIFIVLLIVGFKMWEPILSSAAFFFSFSFMFGPAASKYFEGILLIFVRRPYDIGDKIALSDPQSDTSASGSSTWFVEKVSLFTTTVRFATTNEVATYSNGSLARLRIINAKRSPKAVLYVYCKFASDVPYKMIKVYQTAIEQFVKSRPREWSQLNGFRATRVEMELNFIEYVIVATHREMWQNVGPILQSKADLASFSLEVSKRLNLRYHNPPKPITLSMTKMKKAYEDEGDSYGAMELQQVQRLFGGGSAGLTASDD